MDKKIKILIMLFLLTIILSVFVISRTKGSTTNVIAEKEDLNVTITERGFSINGNIIDIYLIFDDVRANKSDLRNDISDLISFGTATRSEAGNVRYNHTFNRNIKARMSEVGYIFPRGLCSFNTTTTILDCNSFLINFTEAKTIQNIDVNFSRDEFSFKSSDLSYIDPVIIDTGDPDLPINSGGETIVKNSTGGLFVLYSTDTATLVRSSIDSGTTWTASGATGLNCDFDGVYGEGTLLVNSTDGIHIICDNQDDADVSTVYSTDSGVSWSSVVDVETTNSDINEVAGAMDGNDNLIVCIAIGGGAAQINVYNSSDSGTTWTSTSDVLTDADDRCDLEVDSTGRYHVVGGDSSRDEITYATTLDPTSWGSTISIDNGASLTTPQVSMTISTNDNIFIIAESDTSNRNVSFFNSTDNGVTWSETEIPFNFPTAVDEFDIIEDENTNIHVIATHDGSASISGNVSYANSTDGGSTWTIGNLELADAGTGNELRYASFRGSEYPSFNTVDGLLEYVYHNETNNDLYFNNFTIPSSNSAPVLTIREPDNGTTFSTSVVTFNWSFTDADSDNLISYLYINESTANIESQEYFSNLSVAINQNVTNITTLADGTYYWHINYSDGTVQNITSETRTFVVSTTSPAVNLEFPTADNFTSFNNFTFTATATDTDGILNFTLYHDVSGTFIANETNLSEVTSGNSFSWTQVTNIPDGEYIWNALANDGTNDAFASSNRTFTVDTIAPNINLTAPTGTVTSRTSITVDWTTSDINPSICWYNITFSTGVLSGNEFNSVTCGLNTTTASVAVDGDYTIDFFVNDSAKNQNTTQLNFTVDTSSPGSLGGGGDPGPILLASIGTPCTDSSECNGVCINNFCEDLAICGDNTCQRSQGETFTTCIQDCRILTAETFASGSFAQLLLIGLGIFGILFIVLAQPKKKKLNKSKTRRKK